MKLEHRLALFTAGVTVGTIATCLGAAFVLMQHEAARELDQEVLDGANAATVVVAQLHNDDAPPGSEPPALVIPADVALVVERVAVYSPDGKRVATRPAAIEVPNQLSELQRATGAKLNRPFDLRLPEGPMRAVLVSGKMLHGKTLLHAVSRSGLDDRVEFRRRLFVGLFAGTLALVIFSANWLGRRLAADVNRVTAVARRVASGELTARAGTAGLTSPETRNLARELDHMVGQLATLVASQRNFISYAAHELRSPLAAIHGELQLALRRPRTAEAYVEMLSSVLADVVSLTQLAEDLLTLARAQGEAVSGDDSRLDDVLHDALRLVQGAAQIQDMTIDVQADGCKLCHVAGRRGELARIVRNLLENAIKFGRPGGKVQVQASRTGDAIEIAVIDDGPGIAPKDQPSLFDPFFRSSSAAASQVSGTGLGLAIAREVARKAGGDVQLDTEYTGGTRMVVRLVVTQDPGDAA